MMSVDSQTFAVARQLEERLGFEFKNPELLLRAVTHSSSVSPREVRRAPGESNERLEFLGDAVLGLILSNALLRRPEQLPEGVMSRLRAALVNERSLANCARALDLGSFLIVSRGEERGGGRDKDSVLADALEALIAAIFIDQGYRRAERFVLSLFKVELARPLADADARDHKTSLQELTQRQCKNTPTYRVVSKSGPDHSSEYEVEVVLGEQVLGQGRGASKKRASQEAARVALEHIKI